jgi:hypothetical protein
MGCNVVDILFNSNVGGQTTPLILMLNVKASEKGKEGVLGFIIRGLDWFA